MKYFNMLDISFTQIQMFLAAAEEESITRAARALNVTQSTVSKNIKYLEDTLGLYLFIRDKQTLRLTPAGRFLKEEFSKIYIMIQNALEKSHVLQTGTQSPLQIGIPDSSHLQKIFIDTKEKLTEKQIEANLHIECLPFNELKTRLLEGNIDIVITCGFDAASYDSGDFLLMEVPVGPYCAYLDPRNPLSEQSEVEMEELKSCPFLVASPQFTHTYEQLVVSLCQEAGFQPLISKYLTSPNAFICNFDTGQEVFLADGYMRESDNPALRRVPIRGTRSTMAFVRKRTEKNQAVSYVYEKIVHCWQEIHEEKG